MESSSPTTFMLLVAAISSIFGFFTSISSLALVWCIPSLRPTTPECPRLAHAPSIHCPAPPPSPAMSRSSSVSSTSTLVAELEVDGRPRRNSAPDIGRQITKLAKTVGKEVKSVGKEVRPLAVRMGASFQKEVSKPISQGFSDVRPAMQRMNTSFKHDITRPVARRMSHSFDVVSQSFAQMKEPVQTQSTNVVRSSKSKKVHRVEELKAPKKKGVKKAKMVMRECFQTFSLQS
ncbi:hypothetical protein CYLTODRAFT_146213 [Cylindrobasidium torrendii FP15055 ss-10]|uniref:Uncharacterized protein n=1 Tax=Cylindrobasidium torrendii FP15055 ss-10 TaxID=1314674 RepID=A0A0D7B129_9AGAR|nr:hypothetical protein CYLTODRAFT_146213 [Cylindrobasidium torrendii FP15055 ss-10]